MAGTNIDTSSYSTWAAGVHANGGMTVALPTAKLTQPATRNAYSGYNNVVVAKYPASYWKPRVDAGSIAIPDLVSADGQWGYYVASLAVQASALGLAQAAPNEVPPPDDPFADLLVYAKWGFGIFVVVKLVELGTAYFNAKGKRAA